MNHDMLIGATKLVITAQVLPLAYATDSILCTLVKASTAELIGLNFTTVPRVVAAAARAQARPFTPMEHILDNLQAAIFPAPVSVIVFSATVKAAAGKNLLETACL